MRLSELAGLIPDEVGETLADYGSRVPSDQAIVEIGSYKGKSTCYLASRAVAHVWAIDPWDLPANVDGRFGFRSAFPEFQAQVKTMGYEDRITPIQGYGERVGWDGPAVGLLYVDGDHSARAVYADVKAWLPRMAKGGTIICDDLDTRKNPGVRQALDRLKVDFTVEAERLAIWTL